MKRIDLTGQQFGKWTVLRYSGVKRYAGMGQAGGCWECRCACGTERVVSSQKLRQGTTKSCGCNKPTAIGNAKLKHGATRGSKQGGKRSPEYISWTKIKQRCYNPNCAAYPWYGAKGIRLYRLWRQSFAAFLADMGPMPGAGYVVGRKNHAKNYEPSNCFWITKRENLVERHKGYRPPI